MPRLRTTLLVGGGVLVLAAAAAVGDRLVLGNGVDIDTNDAFVTADFTLVAPKVSGIVDVVTAQDNQFVRKGEPIAHIQDDDYRAALEVARGDVTTAQADIENLTGELDRQQSVIDGARATVQADEAARTFALKNALRYRNLSAGGAATSEQQQSAYAQGEEATAAIARDQAAVMAANQQVPILRARLAHAHGVLLRAQGMEHQATLDLSYCAITAPVTGVVGARGVRVGNYVRPGTTLLAVVPTQAAYVLANFQETKLTNVRPGQHATIWVDTFPGHPLQAHVDSIAPATGVAFAPIQPDNATGNFTKVVQRLPVKLVFEPGQPYAARLRNGMSVEARIDTGSRMTGGEDSRRAWN